MDALVKRDFEERGFQVRKCHVYDTTFGIFVEWSLAIKKCARKGDNKKEVRRTKY